MLNLTAMWSSRHLPGYCQNEQQVWLRKFRKLSTQCGTQRRVYEHLGPSRKCNHWLQYSPSKVYISSQEAHTYLRKVHWYLFKLQASTSYIYSSVECFGFPNLCGPHCLINLLVLVVSSTADPEQQDLVEEIRTKQEKGNFRPVEDGHDKSDKYPSWKVDADTANNKRYHFTLGTPQAGEFSNLVLIIYSWTRCDRPVPTSAAALCLTTLNFQVSPGVFYSKVRSSLWWWWVKNWRSPNLANKSTSMESLNWQWMFWGPVCWSFADEAAIVCWLGGSSCACATGTASSTTTGRTTRVTQRTSSWWDARDRCWGVAGHYR